MLISGILPSHRSRTIAIAALTGAVGFLIGCAFFGTWQYALETAQVLAGIVSYPAWNPFYIYHVKLWSLINQVLALLLGMGFTEIQLSLFTSGVIVMLFFQAMALTVWGLSRNAVLACTSPLLLYIYFHVNGGEINIATRPFDSNIYPVILMGQGHTYGMVGLGFSLLLLACIANDWLVTAAFLAGVAPSIHPALGFWTACAIAAGMFVERTGLAPRMKRLILAFGAGGLVTLASFVVQKLAWGDFEAPPIDRSAMANYLLSYVVNNDMHRQPVPLLSWGMVAHGAVLLLTGAWLLRADRLSLPLSTRVLLAAAAGLALISVLLCVASQFPAAIPLELLMSMPGRLQNAVFLVFPLLLLGLLARDREHAPLILLLTAFVAAVACVPLVITAMDGNIVPIVFAGAAVAVLLVLRPTPGDGRLAKLSRTASRAVSVVLAGAQLFLLAYLLSVLPSSWNDTITMFDDWTTNASLNFLRRNRGQLLTASDIGRFQLIARRPVLFDGGALNEVTYALESGPMMDRILKEVYGVDLFSGRSDVRGSALNRDQGKAQWEQRSLEEWQALSREFSFTQVLTYDTWNLQLQVIGTIDPFFTLYGIP